MTKRNYDSTVARIAGNILSGVHGVPELNSVGWRPELLDSKVVAGAVAIARAIVEETKRTEPAQEGS